MTKQTIIDAIQKFAENSGKMYYREFYIGITSDINERLFKEHKVDENSSAYIYKCADTEEIARDVEKHFLDKGMKGDIGGGTGNNDVKWVYCYV